MDLMETLAATEPNIIQLLQAFNCDGWFVITAVLLYIFCISNKKIYILIYILIY